MPFQKKVYKAYPRTRYKSTAWRQSAKAHIKKVAVDYKQRFKTPRYMATNALNYLREMRSQKNYWAKHYHKFAHVKQAKGKALAAQTNWRWRNRNMSTHNIYKHYK